MDFKVIYIILEINKQNRKFQSIKEIEVFVKFIVYIYPEELNS